MINYREDFMNTTVIIPYEGKDWEFKLDKNKGDSKNLVIIDKKSIENRLSMYKELTNNNYKKYKLQEVLIKDWGNNIIAIMPISIELNTDDKKVNLLSKKLLVIDVAKEKVVYAEPGLIDQIKNLCGEISFQNISIIHPINSTNNKYKIDITELNKRLSKLNKNKKYKISKLCSVHKKVVCINEVIHSAIFNEYCEADFALNSFLTEMEYNYKDKINKELLKRPKDSRGLETTVVPLRYKDKDVVTFIFRYTENDNLIEFGRIYLIDNIIYISKEHLGSKRIIKVIPNKETLDSIILTQNELDNMNTIANHPIDYSGTKYENNKFMKNNSLKDPLSHLINLIEPINSLTNKLYSHHPLLKLVIDKQVEKTRGIIKDIKNNYPTNFQEQLLNIMVIDSFYNHDQFKDIEDIIQIKKDRLNIINELPYSDEDKVNALFYIKIITALKSIKKEYGQASVKRVYYETVGEPMSYYMYKYLNKFQNKNLSDDEFLEILKLVDNKIKSKKVQKFECPILTDVV